jgi:hypothetical protein
LERQSCRLRQSIEAKCTAELSASFETYTSKANGTLPNNLSWNPHAWQPWSISSVCSGLALCSRCHCAAIASLDVYPWRPNRQTQNQDFAITAVFLPSEDCRGGPVTRHRGTPPFPPLVASPCAPPPPVHPINPTTSRSPPTWGLQTAAYAPVCSPSCTTERTQARPPAPAPVTPGVVRLPRPTLGLVMG